MTDRVIIVTPPDDIEIDGIRILLVDLFQTQTQILSAAYNTLSTQHTIINYIWRNGDPVEWLINKKHRSDIVIFNADSNNELIVGYLAAQSNSYYFGNLKLLSSANTSAIYNDSQSLDIIEKILFAHNQR